MTNYKERVYHRYTTKTKPLKEKESKNSLNVKPIQESIIFAQPKMDALRVVTFFHFLQETPIPHIGL